MGEAVRRPYGVKVWVNDLGKKRYQPVVGGLQLVFIDQDYDYDPTWVSGEIHKNDFPKLHRFKWLALRVARKKWSSVAKRKWNPLDER